MGQMQNVSWRTVGYSALGTALAAASVIAVFNSDGVHPTALTSSSATKWLVDNVDRQVVLVDGLAGHVVAKVQLDPETDTGDQQEAVQGAGGAFLIDTKQAAVRTISTSKLQLGTPQTVALVSERDAMFGVGPSGLTILSANSRKASVVAVDDAGTRPVEEITPSTTKLAKIAFDGSIWLFTNNTATHVTIDKPNEDEPIRNPPDQTTTIGGRAVTFSAGRNTVVEWSGGGKVDVDALPNASQAILQVPGDDASCVWMASGNYVACVGTDRIEKGPTEIPGLNFDGPAGDRLAVSGSAAAVVRAGTNQIDRIDLDAGKMADDANKPAPGTDAQLDVTATGGLVWIDDAVGTGAWVIHRLGINTIDKNDKSAALLDAQGQPVDNGTSSDAGDEPSGNATGDEQSPDDKLDHNNTEDPPIAVDDSVTARAGNDITIPVTSNDYDPDGEPIALLTVGGAKAAGHGITDVIDANTVAYRPETGYSGTDTFDYTITDPFGNKDTAVVTVQLFPPESPNQPPIARPDHAKTRPNRPINIDVLTNDIDPERDPLTINTFAQDPGDSAIITVTKGPSGLPALRYTSTVAGFHQFTYQAADPQGGLSPKTLVTVEVSGTNAPNEPPVAVPDSVRLRVGSHAEVPVLANDFDPDGEDLFLVAPLVNAPGVDATIRGQALDITLGPGAQPLSVVSYTVSAGLGGATVKGEVLVVRIDDTEKNQPPVANADTARVVIGASVKIPVTQNDVDPDQDPITLLTVSVPANNAGTTTREGNSVRFTPTLEDLTEPTPVTFSYTITDGHNHEPVTGKVTVTVLLEALPQPPLARDDFADTVVDKAVTIDVLANDSDPSGGQPTLSGKPGCPSGGEAVITSDERILFTPPTGSTGTFRCTYTVTNQQSRAASASIIITVTAATAGNHAPTVNQVAISNLSVNVGGTLPINANTIASDVDGDSLVFTSVDNTSSGSASIGANPSSFTYTAPPVGSSDTLPQAVTIGFTISDGNNGNVSDSLSIRLIDPNTTPPPGTPTPPKVIDLLRGAVVGDTVQVDVVNSKELRDANPGATLSLTDAKFASGPGSVLSAAGGIVTMATTGAGELVVNYTVNNTDGVSASAKIRVTVSPVPNNPPVARDDSMVVASGGSGSVELLANDLGITDPADDVRVVLNNRPPSNFGTVQLSPTGRLTFQATADAAGTAPLTYTVSDGSGLSSTATVSITLLPCTESQPFANDVSLFTPYMTPIAINLNDPQFGIVGSIRPGSPSGADLNGATSGVYTPQAGMNGTETVTYIVENGCNQTFQGHLAIDVNRSPVAGSFTKELPRGAPPLVITANDLASDDESLAIDSLSGNPAWVTLVPGSTGSPGSFDNATIQANPPAGTPADTYTMNATVRDPGGLTAVATIKLIIRNLAPTAVADAYTTDQANFTFDPTSNDVDPEGGQLCLTTIAVTGGAGANIISPNPNNPPPGCNSSVHVQLEHGQTTFSYSISDDGSLTDTSTITILYNNAPSVADASGATAGQPSVDVEMTVTEPDGDPVTLTCNSGSGANPAFSTTVRPQPGSGPDPVGHPRFTVTVTVLQPFSSPGIIPCFATDNFGAVSNTATIAIRVIDPG